ncbi:MAG: hypothetical protein KAS23_00710, partial [Anaerohalosphaera sp.]|nr:hypothetical protein [Anaerohalosphaera sp.]
MKSINVTVILLAVFILTVSPYLQAGNWLGFAVSLSDDDQEMPDIDGSLIVFQQLVEGDWDIYAAEISDPQNPLVLAVAAFTNDQTAPAVSGSIVVWQDFVDTDFGIYGTDINDSDNVFTIADYEQDQADQVAPAIQGNTVVWADNYYGDWDIYAADISNTSAPVVFSVTPFTGDQTSADVFGTNVVWQDVGTSPEDTILYLTDISNTASLVHNIIAD